MKLISAVVTALVLFLGACGTDPPYTGSGTVVEINYDDPDDWYQPGIHIAGTLSCSGGYNGVPYTCTRSPDINTPGYWVHDGPNWHVVLDKTTDGKRHRIRVTQAEFEECQVGDHWSPNEGGCP